jgi:hypothetical protein
MSITARNGGLTNWIVDTCIKTAQTGQFFLFHYGPQLFARIEAEAALS